MLHDSRGFTLIELVVTLVILGILSVGISGFIGSGVSGYVSARDREALQGEARFAIERVGRELKNAVPNSVTIELGGKCVSYYPIYSSGFYEAPSGLPLSVVFAESNIINANTFKGKKIVFSPQKSNDFSDAKTIRGITKSDIANVANDSYQVTLDKLPTGLSTSPTKRFYVLGKRVQFCFESGQLVRKEGATQFPLSKNVLVSGSAFSLQNISLNSHGLLKVQYTFSQNGETSVFDQEVPIVNVP
ncbi:PilW family protein [Veronia pacifica]|uniref:MSHA biogenesis protein MshO n=1 Tax=Veronia pacifica TaxID=1080227 RepID=A0A1C3ELN9_9GAMM|nr:type II secretion system protein [Veronia pacifica]ODA34142.1 hypothetical protein A8L45_07635 [Veronia pacifica]